MTRYYGMDGQPLSRAEWIELFEGDFETTRRVGQDTVGEAQVSTVLLALDHNWGGGPPLIFESMIFGGDHDQDQWRYSTLAEAEAGHRRIVEALQRGEEPPEHLPEVLVPGATRNDPEAPGA